MESLFKNFNLAGTLKKISLTSIVVPSEQLIIKDYTKDIVEVLEEIRDALAGKWTDEEIAILNKYYLIEPTSEFVKRLPNRSYSSIITKAQRLGLVRDNHWTEVEDEVLRKYYHIDGGNVYLRFNGAKSSHSCKNRARKLHLKFDNPWSETEDDIMRKYYPVEGLSIRSRLPGKSDSSIKGRAIKLGVSVKNRRLSCAYKVRCVETGVVYDSAPIVASMLKCNRASVNSACKTGKLLYGYHYEYVKEKRD